MPLTRPPMPNRWTCAICAACAPSRVIAEEPESDAEDELDLFEHIPGLEEARSVAKLSDTNIVTVYDCAVEGSSAYVIMEYVEGKTLAQIIDEVDDDITLDVVAAVFSAVSHALGGGPRRAPCIWISSRKTSS